MGDISLQGLGTMWRLLFIVSMHFSNFRLSSLSELHTPWETYQIVILALLMFTTANNLFPMVLFILLSYIKHSFTYCILYLLLRENPSQHQDFTFLVRPFYCYFKLPYAENTYVLHAMSIRSLCIAVSAFQLQK